MLTKAKILLDLSLPTPPFLDNTPINTLITSLIIPDKSSLASPSNNKKARVSTPSHGSSSISSSSTRKYRGSRMKSSELVDVKRLIDWSA